MIELNNEVRQERRVSMRSFIFCLVLIVCGYWLTTYAIIGYYKGMRKASQYIIQHDLANTGIDAKSMDKITYVTATQLDDCRDRLEQVRLSIIDLPLGGPERVNVASR